MAAGAGGDRDIDDLPKNAANYTALTPLWFLERAACAHPQRASVIHGSIRYTWSQTYERCRRLASALYRRSIGPGSTRPALCPSQLLLLSSSAAWPCGAIAVTGIQMWRAREGRLAPVDREQLDDPIICSPSPRSPLCRRRRGASPESARVSSPAGSSSSAGRPGFSRCGGQVDPRRSCLQGITEPHRIDNLGCPLSLLE